MFVLFERKCPAKCTSQDIPPWFQERGLELRTSGLDYLKISLTRLGDQQTSIGWVKTFFFQQGTFLSNFKLGVGDMAKISYHNFITILCHVGFTILSDQCSQNNFPIIQTKPFKVTKYVKEWWIFRPKWAKIKIFFIILYLLLKNKNKDTHYKNT